MKILINKTLLFTIVTFFFSSLLYADKIGKKDYYNCHKTAKGCFSHPLRPERERTLFFDEWAEAQIAFEKTKREKYRDVTEFETEITEIYTSSTTATIITKNEEKIFLACKYWAYDGHGGYKYPAAVLTPHTDTPIVSTKLKLKPLFYQKIKTDDCKEFVDRAREELNSCTSNESQMVMRINFNTGLKIISDCVSKGNSWAEKFFDQYRRNLDFLSNATD